MAKSKQKDDLELAAGVDNQPKSLPIFARGIKTGGDFATGMSALMTDVIAGAVSPQVANAVCNAGGKLLKVVEMGHKYGGTAKTEEKVLRLAE